MKHLSVAVLHQGCVPVYRRAFYERLAAIADHRYVVFHGDPEPGSGITAARPPFAFEHVEVRNHYRRLLGRTFVYQPVIRRILRDRFDALVIGHEVKYAANILLALAFRAAGKPVLLWGFGRNIDTAEETRSALGRCLGRTIRLSQDLLIRVATDFLAYTPSGARYVEKAGMPADRITVLNNTIDISGEIAIHARASSLDRNCLRREWGLSPDAVVLLFVGRLKEAKKVDALIGAVRALRQRQAIPVEVLIVGAGPQEAHLKNLADGATWCRFLGKVYDPDAVGQIFRISDAVVIPGYVGLAVNLAFAYGLPVITCQSRMHSPEIEYVQNSVNGLLLPSIDELASGLLPFVTSRELRQDLAAGALASRDKLDLQQMVDAFDSGVRRALARSEAGGLSARRSPAAM